METNQMSEQFLKVYEDFADSIFRYCYFKVSDREKARDLMQETFTRAWQYLTNGGRIDNIRAFLFRIANNLVIDEYRKKKPESLDQLREKGFDVIGDKADTAINLAQIGKIMEAIWALGDSYREVLVMRFVEDLSPGEIAAALNESENAISVRIHRGVKKLKELIT